MHSVFLVFKRYAYYTAELASTYLIIDAADSQIAQAQSKCWNSDGKQFAERAKVIKALPPRDGDSFQIDLVGKLAYELHPRIVVEQM